MSRPRERVRPWGIAALSVGLLADPTRAAEIIIEVRDGPGEGFNDEGAPDAAAVAGGNQGATLGEQRLLAFQYAADQWASRLESDVPLVVVASMDDLECTATGAVLGSAAPTTFIHDQNVGRWFTIGLANARAGSDLAPLAGDIVAAFNASLDSPGCLGSVGWYYGLDGAPPEEDVDFLSVVLHELAHGLGFSSMMDYESGEFLGNNDNPDSYSALIFDVTAGKRWSEMSNAERASSVTNVRQLAWDGTEVTAAAPTVLAPSQPALVATPSLTGFRGAISETNFGPTALGASTAGEVVEVNNSCNVPAELEGKVILMRFSSCLGVEQAEAAGAVFVLIDTGVSTTPPGDLNIGTPVDVGIPTLHISSSDADALSNALANQTVELAITLGSARVGTDASGRVLINATVPVSYGSSIAHWDSLTRQTADLDDPGRDLLMEPAGLGNGVQLDLTEELMLDIGWGENVCGDGALGGAETCDDGEDNSNTVPDACRTNCLLARCGDNVVDSGEECDDGNKNGSASNGCQVDCSVAQCGDGVLDTGEDCDDGDENSDTAPNACRLDCSRARCGDSVIDTGEQCDDGTSNGAPTSACSSGCAVAVCGDGAVSRGEQCDDGNENSDSAPDACRVDCTLARCGDGVVDSTEGCDDGSANSNTTADACRTDCGPPFCGDTVVDSGEQCDDGADNGSRTSQCTSACSVRSECGNGTVEGDEQCDTAEGNSDSAPNSCRNDCTLPSCGDSVVDDGEACDDGNAESGDACSADCKIASPTSADPTVSPPIGQGGSGNAGDTPTSPTSGDTAGAGGTGEAVETDEATDTETTPLETDASNDTSSDSDATSAPTGTDGAADAGSSGSNSEPELDAQAGESDDGCGCVTVGHQSSPSGAPKPWAWLLIVGCGLALSRCRIRPRPTERCAGADADRR